MTQPQFFADAELLAVSELKGAWGDEVFHGKAAWGEPFPFKGKLLLFVDVEHIVHQGQTLLSVQRFRRHTEPLEVVEQVRLDAFQPWLCRFHGGGFNAKSQIFCLDKTVVATGKLITEHIGVLPTDIVKVIALRGNDDALSISFLIRRHVHKGQLEFYRAVEVVQKIAPALEDSGFILVLIELVVDVLKLNRLVSSPVSHGKSRPETIRSNGMLSWADFFLLS